MESPSLFDVVHEPASRPSTAHPLTHSSSRSPSTTRHPTTHRTTSHSRKGITLPIKAHHPHRSSKPSCAIGSEKVLKNHRDRRAKNDLPFGFSEADLQELIDAAKAAADKHVVPAVDKLVVPIVDAPTNLIDSITDDEQNPNNGYMLPPTKKKKKKFSSPTYVANEDSGQDRLVGSLLNLCSMIMLVVCAHFF